MRRTFAAIALLSTTLILAACEQDSPTGTADSEDTSGAFEPDPGARIAEQLNMGFHRDGRTYEITIENLTRDTGDGGAQVFSPPVLATHDRSARLYRVGEFADEAFAGLAEDAVNGPVVDALRGSRGVLDVLEGAGPIPPGASATYEIQASNRMRRVSAAFMLVNTNDGFSGLDSYRLPRQGEVSIEVYAYDAGSEANSELQSEIPGPCCGTPGAGTPTHARIRRHDGITGEGDLDPAKWGWDGPVARITIRAREAAYRVTLSNLTPETGDGGAQVFSPPVLATHRGGHVIYRYGRPASEELAGVAEDALNGPLVEALESHGRVLDVVEGDGVVPPGSTASYTVTASRKARRLSMAFMLVNTNDAFGGVNSIRLPRQGRVTYELYALDAGSEKNTELTSEIPGPCCGSPGKGEPTHDRIGLHQGIQGVGDLTPEKWGWTGAVATLTVERIR